MGKTDGTMIPVVEGVPVDEERSKSPPPPADSDELPKIENRTGPSRFVTEDVEPHVLLSASLLVCAVGCDCLTSIDILDSKTDAPTSYRVTSLVLVLILSSPVLKGLNLVDQRVFLALFLCIFSLLGLHESTQETRTGDATYTIVVLLMSLYIVNQGGIENESLRPDSKTNKPHKKQSVAAFCAALMFYASLRGLRAAFVAPYVAANYVVEYTTDGGTVVGRGYAVSTTDTTVPLGFCHGVGVATAALIGLHDDARVVGSSAVAFEVGVAGLAIMLGSMWTLFGQSKQFETLQVLYGSGACRGGEDVCFESARARRLSFVNNSSASAFLIGLAAVAFAFSVERRFVSVLTRSEQLWKQQGTGLSFVLLVLALIGVFSYANFSGDQWHTDVVTLVSLLAIFTSLSLDTLVGTIMYAVAMTYNQLELLEFYGGQRVLVHLTHCTLFISLVLMWIWITAAMAKTGISCFFTLRDNSILNQVMGIVCSFGASLTFGLYIASALLIASSSGNIPQEDDTFRGGSPKRSLLAFFLDHFVPFLVWAPLYVCRCEIDLISKWSRAVSWLTAVPVDCAIYVAVLAALGEQAPSAALMQVSPMAAVGCAGLLAWSLGAFI